MPTWLYFSRSNNMALHDLTSYLQPPANLRCLLGMNLKFIPRKKYTTEDMTEHFDRFRQKVFIKDYYSHFPPDMQNSEKEQLTYHPKLHIQTH